MFRTLSARRFHRALARRVSAVALLAVCIFASPLVFADDAPPSAPGGLSARAYSGTVGGIAWRRSSDDRGAVRGYEITRDGRSLGIRDALSYVDNTLRPGSTYRYGVVAIDSAGQRSALSSVTLITPGAGGTPPDGPVAPAGLRANVYSSTALGLAWTRATRVGLRYEVRRDGQVLGTTDGTSYIDRSLTGGREYRYEVIAIDRQGRRSTASSVAARTPLGGGNTSAGPAAPAGLRTNVYSSTALGLAWTRGTRVGLRYDVRRDGQALGTTDGTSYIDRSLTGGREYRYEVITIDRQGRRSAAAITKVRTPGEDPGTPLKPPKVSLELVADKIFRISWQPSAGATSYRVLENPDGVSGFTRIGGDLGASTRGLDHRVALYSRVNARYVVQACNDSGCADSDERIVSGALERAIGYFKASNASGGNTVVDNVAGDEFGAAVSLSADGNTLAVGAREENSAATGINGDQNDNSVRSAGAVYVFARIDGAWRQQAYLKASNTGNGFLGDHFGETVSLSADGNTLAIGASDEASAATGANGDQDDNSAEGSGAVYVFHRGNGKWRQQAYLKASNTEANDRFGLAVSLSTDGNTLAVGARDEDSAATGINGDQGNDSVNGSASDSGAVYVFARSNGNWQQQAYVKASNTALVRHFGASVSLSANGNTLAIGAPEERSVATGINGDQTRTDPLFLVGQGAAYVFVRSEGIWRQQAYVKASNTDAGDEFGRVIGLSADGDTLAVGAPGEDSAATGIDGDQSDNSGFSSGAIYVFVRSSGSWQQQAYLKAGTGRPDVFPDSISLSANGDTLAAGASREDSAATGINGNQNDESAADSGAAYVFKRGSGSWQQQAYVKASNTAQPDVLINFEGGTVERSALFGEAVSLSADGDTLAIGAPGEHGGSTGINGDQNDDSEPQSGAVYLY